MMKQEENGHTKLIEQARTLLSPYLDDEVTPAERELVETVLAQSPELQTELENLQATVNLVRELPRVSAPRPFTLTETEVGLTSVERKAFSWSTWLKPVMGGLVVVIAVLIAVAYLLRPGLLQPRPGLLQPSQQEAPSVAHAPDQSAESVAEEAAEAPAVAPAQEERAGEEEAAVVETVVEPGEVEKVVEVEKEVEVAEEPPAEPAAEEAVTLDTGAETKSASEAPPEPEVSKAEAVSSPQPPPTSSPVMEMLAQPEPVEEPAAAEVAEEGIAEQKVAPEVAQEAVVTPTTAALATATATPFATATPSPMTTPFPPTATPTEVEVGAERSLEQPVDDGATATSVATVTPPPTVLAQATRTVEQAQTPIAQKPDFTSTASSSEVQNRDGRETSLITLLPTGLMIMLVVGGILVAVLLWRFFRQR